MAFVELVQDERLPAEIAADAQALGYVPNYMRAFAHRPGAFAAWKQLVAAIKGSMDERRYELATLAAARRLRSSYCSLAHGKILAEKFFGPDEVAGIAKRGVHARRCRLRGDGLRRRDRRGRIGDHRGRRRPAANSRSYG